MPSTATNLHRSTHYKNLAATHPYYSVQFGLNDTHPVYQFKLWHSDRTPHFFLLKETSALARQLKVGHTILMTYYCNDPRRGMEQRETRIESIVNETNGRFQGHYRIQLSILDSHTEPPLQATGTNN